MVIAPKDTRKEHTLELLNEIVILLICEVLLLYTDFVPIVKTKYRYGWYTVYGTVLIVAANVLTLLLENVLHFCNKCKLKKVTKRRDKIIKQLIANRLALTLNLAFRNKKNVEKRPR